MGSVEAAKVVATVDVDSPIWTENALPEVSCIDIDSSMDVTLVVACAKVDTAECDEYEMGDCCKSNPGYMSVYVTEKRLNWTNYGEVAVAGMVSTVDVVAKSGASSFVDCDWTANASEKSGPDSMLFADAKCSSKEAGKDKKSEDGTSCTASFAGTGDREACLTLTVDPVVSPVQGT